MAVPDGLVHEEEDVALFEEEGVEFEDLDHHEIPIHLLPLVSVVESGNLDALRQALGRSPRIDGKEFFRQARSRLSLEQFSEFLENIKELNAQRQSREVTLRKAEEIFGT